VKYVEFQEDFRIQSATQSTVVFCRNLLIIKGTPSSYGRRAISGMTSWISYYRVLLGYMSKNSYVGYIEVNAPDLL